MKKVIFYNVTLDSILRHKHKALEKMDYIFHMFQQWNDVVLIWRPHPLLETTIKSMIPELLSEYYNLVNSYKNSKWGIYDDTSDMYNAIAISDAYYGDWSSVVTLYEVTGKPILIQNIDIIKEDIIPRFAVENCIWLQQDENISYFVTPSMNGLFRYHNDGHTKLVHPLKLEDEGGQLLYYTGAICNGKILISPRNANSFVMYDIENNKIRYYDAEEVSGKLKDFYYLASYENSIYAIGANTQLVMKFDTKSETFLNICIDTPGNPQMYSFYFTNKEKVTLLNYGEGKMWEFDMKEEIAHLLDPATGNMSIGNVLWDGNYYWLLQTDRNVITRWSIKNNEMFDIVIPKNKDQVAKIISSNNDIWIFAEKGNEVLRINKDIMKINSMFMKALDNKLIHRFIELKEDWILVKNYIRIENRYLLNEEYYSYFNYKTGEERRIEIPFPNTWNRHKIDSTYLDFCLKKYKNICKGKSYAVENFDIDISFLRKLLFMEKTESMQEYKKCGKTIHNAISDFLCAKDKEMLE